MTTISEEDKLAKEQSIAFIYIDNLDVHTQSELTRNQEAWERDTKDNYERLSNGR